MALWTRARIRCAFWLATSGLVAGAGVSQQMGSGDLPGLSTTEDRVRAPGWWPTKGTPPMTAYAGDAACAECHLKQIAPQRGTSMAHAAWRADMEGRSHQLWSPAFKSGSYLYRIDSNRSGSSLVVTSGDHSVSTAITWIMGAGVHGQTYILEDKGKFYESQVSGFSALGGMDLSPGHTMAGEGELENASGEKLSLSSAARCFACHTTESSTQEKFDSQRAVPGIHCEACHGPGAAHGNAMQSGQVAVGREKILNPEHLSSTASVDFCGACHRTTLDVVEAKVYGIGNLRFQPYRLQKSRCWGTAGDARLICVACHDPHVPLVQSAESYDRVCLNCHGAASAAGAAAKMKEGRPVRSCSKGTVQCVGCHMPKYDVPEMHAKFTDHFIRIVRGDQPYPN